MYDARFSITPDATMTARDLVAEVGGVESISGDADISIESIAPLDQAVPGYFTFCRTVGPAAEAAVRAAGASTVVVGFDAEPAKSQCLIRVSDPRGWFIDALNHLCAGQQASGIHSTASIAEDVVTGTNVAIGANAVISTGCVIGDGGRIGSGVHLGPGTVLGQDCTIHPNSVVGAVGLGYHDRPDNSRVLFPHLGRVIVGDGVTIGVGCCITRGMIEHTVIGDRVTIGNLVNVGHNCHVGDDVSISAGVVLTGGVVLEVGAKLAASVSVNSHVNVGAGARIGMGSVVSKDVPAGTAVFGVPAKPLRTLGTF